MNCISSLVGLNDCSMSTDWNKNNPLMVQTLDNMMYHKFLKQILFLSFCHDDTITMPFDCPCSLFHIDELLMLAGKSFI